jgi:hypothetical protein
VIRDGRAIYMGIWMMEMGCGNEKLVWREYLHKKGRNPL